MSRHEASVTLMVLAIAAIALRLAMASIAPASSGSAMPDAANQVAQPLGGLAQSGIRKLQVYPRSAASCGQVLGMATYEGNKVAQHGWDIRFSTTHRCANCPPPPSCQPSVQSRGSIIQPSGNGVDNEFLNILSYGPIGQALDCSGFTGYRVEWAPSYEIEQRVCSGTYTYRLEWPIKIRVMKSRSDLSVRNAGPLAGGEPGGNPQGICELLIPCSGEDTIELFIHESDPPITQVTARWLAPAIVGAER